MHTMTMSRRMSSPQQGNGRCVLFSTAGPAVLLILLVISDEVSAGVTSSGGGETTSTTIQCYECEWDHQTGCKTGAKVNNNHLRPNCTVCYKNVVQYVQGQAAASGEYTVYSKTFSLELGRFRSPIYMVWTHDIISLCVVWHHTFRWSPDVCGWTRKMEFLRFASNMGSWRHITSPRSDEGLSKSPYYNFAI